MTQMLSHWWDQRSRFEKLLLSVAFILATALAFRDGVVEPIRKWQMRVQERIAMQELRLKAGEAFLRRKAALEERLKRAREERGKLNSWLLSGKSPALSAVELQEIVQTIAARSGARITSISLIPHEANEGFRKISVKLAVEGDLSGLSRLLHGLETHPKKLVIPNFEVRSFTPRAVRATPPREDLRASLTVFGWMSERGVPESEESAKGAL